mgnify:CR=1 FL=1
MTRANVIVDGQAIVAPLSERPIVEPVTQQSITVVAPDIPAKVAIIADGPLATTGGTFAALADVDVNDKTNKSVIYYDDTSGKYKADSSETLISLTDGGNF